MAIKRGDVIQMGPHRMMCGDCTNPQDVKVLCSFARPDLVFTSPPYLTQRNYDVAGDLPWRQMMASWVRAISCKDDTQILVNLGMVHRNSEWTPYWQPWMDDIKPDGWRQFGIYIWDKMDCMPGDRNGRLSPTFEFIFHINRRSRDAAKTVSCQHVNTIRADRSGSRGRSASCMKPHKNPTAVSSHKVRSSVIRAYPEKTNRTDHPAVFPLALPMAIVFAYCRPGEVVYDPFSGSGTTLIAADMLGRDAFAMEISPKYCQIAVDRYWRHKEKQV